MQDLQMLQDVATRRIVVASTRHHPARLLKYHPRQPCAPSFVKSRMLRPLQTHFLFFQQIVFVLVCIHQGTPRVPPRVLSGQRLSCEHGGLFSTPYLIPFHSIPFLWPLDQTPVGAIKLYPQFITAQLSSLALFRLSSLNYIFNKLAQVLFYKCWFKYNSQLTLLTITNTASYTNCNTVQLTLQLMQPLQHQYHLHDL